MTNPSESPLVQWVLIAVQVATLVAVIVYVWKTWQMAHATLASAQASAGALDEMRTARREASAPRPIIYFGTDSVALSEIIVENVGQTTAADLSFSFTPPLQASQQSDQVTKFFDTPKHVPPGARLRHAFDSWPQYFGASLPLQYSVVLRYRRPGESEFSEDIQVLDAAGFQYYMQWRRKGLHEVAEELHKLVEAGERVAKQDGSFRQKAAAAECLTPTSMNLSEAVASLRCLWKGHKATKASERVIDWIDPYLLVMRRAAITALMRVETMSPQPQLTDALLAVFLALHNHEWQTMGITEAESELDAAMSTLDALVPTIKLPVD